MIRRSFVISLSFIISSWFVISSSTNLTVLYRAKQIVLCVLTWIDADLLFKFLDDAMMRHHRRVRRRVR